MSADTRIVYADLALHSLHSMDGGGNGDKVLTVSTTSIYAPNVSNAMPREEKMRASATETP